MEYCRWSFVRPATLVLCCCLAAAGFLQTFLLKFDYLYYADMWPHHDVWAKLSTDAPRLPSEACPSPQCPTITNIWNRSQFAQPFINVEDVCPFYFSYIHEDLAPWASGKDINGKIISGISKEMLDSARSLARFRVVIKSGRLYVDVYRKCIQTRAIFTIWGLLQLLKYYPGLVPDVDLLFACGDTPRVSKRNCIKNEAPPPVFHYCSTENHFEIPFPDWSFWGWPDIDIRPWDSELASILKAENELLWEQRHPTAFWKGNTAMGKLRQHLMECNGPYAEIIHQDWIAAANAQYKNSRLSQQCKNRYKIYVEGRAWSVSLKYILACDSPVLLVDPMFYDFFTRGLMPLKHYWPIRPDKLCSSIKFGVEWGNSNKHEAVTLGRSGQRFVSEEVSMKHVYDYMLHALNEYAKLLRFAPMPGQRMREVCAEEMMCRAPERERVMYEESTVRQASGRAPCFLGARDKKLVEARLRQRASMENVVQQAEDAGNWINATHIITTSTPL